jgi:hypothetical protein
MKRRSGEGNSPRNQTVAVQRAGNPPRFSMQVEHGRFQVVVPQHHLEIANKRPAHQSVGGKSMAKQVRC